MTEGSRWPGRRHRRHRAEIYGESPKGRHCRGAPYGTLSPSGPKAAGRGCQDEPDAAVADNERLGDPASELSDRPIVLAVVLDPCAHRAGLMIIELDGNVSTRDARDHATAARALTEYPPESLRYPARPRRPRRPPSRVVDRLL